jgi:hypothetical protein
MSVATDLAHEQQVLERQIELHKQRADTAEARLRRAELDVKLAQRLGLNEHRKLAKQVAEAATALLVSAIAIYIRGSDDPQHARNRVQSYLAARLVPVVGAEIPALPFGPDAEL